MKKLLAGLVILSLGLFTLGCGGETKTTPKKPDTKPATSAPADKAPTDKAK